MSEELQNIVDASFVNEVKSLVERGRNAAYGAVNAVMIETYWRIGQRIVEQEQKGKERAEYGTQLIEMLSEELTKTYGKGFSKRNLQYFRSFYLTFNNLEIVQTRLHNLKWSHILTTLRVEDALPRILGEQIAEGGEAIVYDHGATLIKAIGLDYFIQPILALDRISLHNTYFPETALKVLGFGRTADGDFKIVAEQPFIEGTHMSDEEIALFAEHIGFKLINPSNWTFATPEIYLSDLHDENVIRSKEGNVFVVDCDIRINTPNFRCGGIRCLTTEVEISLSKN